MKNPKIWNWLDRGDGVSALCGDKDFFIPDVTYRDKHDLTLVMGQLLLWAHGKGHQADASHMIEVAIRKFLLGRELEKALRLTLVYLNATRNRQIPLPVDLNGIVVELTNAIQGQARELAANEQLRSLRLSVSDRLPEGFSFLGVFCFFR